MRSITSARPWQSDLICQRPGNDPALWIVVVVVRIRVPCVPGSTSIRRRGRSFG